MSETATRQAAERVARESYGRLVAFLSARTRDVAGAEDALADAFAEALSRWPVDGVPANPDGWLLTVARHRQTDVFRRRKTRQTGQEHVILMAEELAAPDDGSGFIPDRRLALMFACAHPDIEAGMRAPLILQTILGLNARDIAAAFLISPTSMGQRLVRAKARIKEAGTSFTMPEPEDLPARLDSVLEAIYAAFAKGWSETGGDGTPPLADEALWLGQIIISLLPHAPEAKGMMALMLYAESRRATRRDSTGAYIPLDEQDTALWDMTAIEHAEMLLHHANAAGPSGRYQIEAAIQSAHVARRLHGVDTAEAVAALYDHLYAITGSPVVALNRAVATLETEGAATALKMLDVVAKDLDQYQPYWAARGHVLALLEQNSAAYDALTMAIGLSQDPAVRKYLHAKCANLPRN